MTIRVRSQETSKSKLTPEVAARELARGQKAASECRSRYWSEPWAYPFESDEHYEGRREAFERGFDPSFINTVKTRG